MSYTVLSRFLSSLGDLRTVLVMRGGQQMGGQGCTPCSSFFPKGATLLSLLAVTCCLQAEADRGGGGWCGDRRGVGDKWFDGCQWCVCTLTGPHCSSSVCSGLVDQVPTCHVTGQRWTDGCYRCRCGRLGITCRLDVTCRWLLGQPVPCLSDERCVCGLDGVPSCTAEVIDRNAFTARRVQLGFSHTLESKKNRHRSHRPRHPPGTHRGERAGRQHVGTRSSPSRQRHLTRLTAGRPPHRQRQHEAETSAGRRNDVPFSRVTSPRGLVSAGQSAPELFITSDNLCRFGARWYGGSLRCFCDRDGAVACGNPVFVLAFFDDFRVQSKPCQEGHSWEDNCSVCTCHGNGVVFCRHTQNCPEQRPFQAGSDDDDAAGGDGYLKVLPEESDPVDWRIPSARKEKGPALAASHCRPGWRWTEGCLQCRCTRHARRVCSRHQCGENNVETHVPTHEDVDIHVPTHEDVDIHVSTHGDADTHLATLDETDGVLETRPSRNQAKDIPITLPSSKRFRGPMLVAPKPPGAFQAPAYATWSARPPTLRQCGRFHVGDKYWDDCNLCLCTSRGPRCHGKLCR